MNEQTSTEVIKTIVERFFHIDDITTGNPKDGFITRFRGLLTVEDSERAFFELSAALKPYHLMPLFRKDGFRHVILLVDSSTEPKQSNPWINLILFVVTFFSMLLTGAISAPGNLSSDDPMVILKTIITLITSLKLFSEGWPFAVSMMSILLAHEFGHYLMGRRYGIRMTLPYLIPLPYPLSPFGTMGAVISMKEVPRNRRQLLDIGLAGPLVGLIVAIPVLFLGLKLSTVGAIPGLASGTGSQGLTLEGNSILYLLMKYLAFGKLLPAPASYADVSPVLYWIKYFFTGLPFPAGGTDVMLHSVAWAGWGGLLLTAMNLIPVGQLDGGHVLYVLLGKERLQKIFPMIIVILVGLGFRFPGWWLLAAILFLLGRFYAEPADQITELDGKRKALAILGLIVFVLVFIPVPFAMVG